MGTSLSSINFLNDLLTFFQDRCLNGLGLLSPDASYLIYLLGILDICMVWACYFGEARFQELIVKAIKIGFFFFMVDNWKYLTIDVIFETFKIAGQVASNSTFDPSPSGILNKGIFLTKDVLASITDGAMWSSVLGGLGLLAVKLVFAIVIIGAFGYMAIQLLLINIEFYMAASLSVILVPFGLIKYTSFLFEKTIGAMFSYGVKLMFMTFILGLGTVLFDTWNTSLSAEAKPQEIITAAFGALTYAYLVWKIPDAAAGFFNGSPSLDAGAAIGGAKSAAGAALSGGASMATAALSGAGAVSAAAKAASGSTRMAAATSFARNIGVAGYNSAKHAAFGSNFISSRNMATNAINKHNQNK